MKQLAALALPLVVALATSLAGCKSDAADAKSIDPTLLQRFEARTFKDSAGQTLQYRLFKPPGYKPGRADGSPGSVPTNYPLVLFLHGAAGLGDDNERQFNGGNEVPPLALSADDAQARFPSFVLAPQCPRGESWIGSGSEPARMIRLTLEALESLRHEFRIDPKRLYLVGVSMGGNGVWDVAVRFPKRFAAVVPICGAGDPAMAPLLTNLPIWCFHGAADPLISVKYPRRMMEALRKAGGKPRYTEYPGVGHDSYRNAFKEPELLSWMFGQQAAGAK